MQRLANITKIEFSDKLAVGLESVLIVEGYLSDPLWEIKRESVDIDEPAKKIVVRIWVSRDPSLMAAQVTKDFVKEYKITFLSAGKWMIQVNDKNLEVVVE